MGLDMYLSGKISYYATNKEEKGVSEKIREIIDMPATISGNIEFTKVEFELGYWRKANQIHRWFVENCQDGEDNCRPYYVGREQLEELKGLCEEVLINKDKASELLPSLKGFFFGSYEYDDYYFQDLRNTVDIISKALAMSDKVDFIYQSSW